MQTTHQSPSPNLAVRPVVDYEPPARSIGRHRASSSASPGGLHRRRASPPPERLPLAAARTAPREAAMFADAALRRVLEVVDHRRPAAHLYPLLTAALVDSILSARPPSAGTAGGFGTATLQRLRLQPVESDGPPTAVEVFGSYRRGRRTHAVACRVERVRADNGPGWQIVALQIG
ncbi:MAG TPA: Rv3235 family protein [Mycobacterium sp.]